MAYSDITDSQTQTKDWEPDVESSHRGLGIGFLICAVILAICIAAGFRWL